VQLNPEVDVIADDHVELAVVSSKEGTIQVESDKSSDDNDVLRHVVSDLILFQGELEFELSHVSRRPDVEQNCPDAMFVDSSSPPIATTCPTSEVSSNVTLHGVYHDVKHDVGVGVCSTPST
jgi:hypothetical protein